MSLPFPHGLLSDESTKKLTEQLYEKDWQVRGQAARLLTKFGDERATEALLETLNSRVRTFFGIEAIGEIAGTEAIEPLRNLLHQPTVTNSAFRLEVAKILNRQGQPDGLEELLNLLKDPLWIVRNKAVFALANSHDPKVKEILKQLAENDPEVVVRLTAQRVLANFDNQPDVEVLAQILITPGHRLYEGQAAVELYRLGDERGFNFLAEKLEKGNTGVARLMGELGDPRVNELLLSALEKENPRLQKNVIETFGELKELRAVEPLLKLLITSYYDENDREFDELVEFDENYIQADNIEARLAAARALLKLDPQKALPVIQELMWHENEPAVLRAGLALLAQQQGDDQAVEVIQKLLTETSFSIITLNKITEIIDLFQNTTVLLDPLLAKLQSGQAWQYEKTLEALGRLGDKRAIEPIKAWQNQLPRSTIETLVRNAQITLIELGIETALIDLRILLTEIINWREKKQYFQGLDAIVKRVILVAAKIADQETIPLLENLLLTELSSHGSPGTELEDLLAQTIYQLKQAKGN